MSIRDSERKEKVVLAPAADRFDSDPTTSVVNMVDANGVRFLIPKTVSTGKGTITIEKCDSAGANNVAVPFHYRETAAGVAGDITAATASGFTTAAATTLVEAFVTAQALGALQYCQLAIVESVNDPVIAAVLADVDSRSSF